MGVRSVSMSASFSTLGKDLRRIHECLVFLKLKSVRSCALILKPNSVRWWERAHLCVRARVCVCVRMYAWACVCSFMDGLIWLFLSP